MEKNYIELKKRSSLANLSLGDEIWINVSATPDKSKNDSERPSTAKVIEISVDSEKKSTSEMKLAKILKIYEEKFPQNFYNEVEKQRKKVKKILFEALLSSSLEMFEKLSEIRFDFSIANAEELSLLSPSQMCDYIATIAHEIEEQLILKSFNHSSKDSLYFKKSRFFTIFFKKEKLNIFFVRLILKKMSVNQLISLNEEDFSDKQIIENYEAKFWTGREILEENVVIKNHKVR